MCVECQYGFQRELSNYWRSLSSFPSCVSFPPSPPLFLSPLQMLQQWLVLSCFSLVFLASPLVAKWELEKDGKQTLRILYRDQTSAGTLRQPLGGSRLKWATIPWGFLARTITLEKYWPHVLHSWLRVPVLFGFHIRWQRGSFLWTMVERETNTDFTKTQLYHRITIPKWRFEKYRNFDLSCPTPPHDITSSVGTKMTYLWPNTLGQSIAFRLTLTWVHKAGSATYWLYDLEQGHLWAWASSIVNQGLQSDPFYMDYYLY